MGTFVTAKWAIAKYVPDLRRREAQNVGVILFVPGNVLCRFKGQREDGDIDGRRARFAGSPDMYKAWVRYWRQAATSSSDAVIGALLSREPDQNYFLELGGERVYGGEDLDPGRFLTELYGTLVEPEPEDETGSARELSDSVLRRLDIADRVERDVELTLPVTDGVIDSVIFDYRYNNGRANLMRTVTLTHTDKRSWDNCHSATWDLQHAAVAPVDENQQLISLVKTRPMDSALDRQLALLSAQANAVLDVGEEEAAAEQLSDLLAL